METQQIKDIVIKELPELMQNDAAFRKIIIQITRTQYADKAETRSHFDRMMDEMVRNREMLEQKMEQARLNQEKSDQHWEENNRRWEENNRRWKENHKELVKLTDALQHLGQKYDQTLGSLGSRWGFQSEASFRDALSAIIKDYDDVEVLNVNEFDDEGIVFGHPEQIELDIVIKNGKLIICELKSSVSKSEMYTFDKKVKFYEKKHNCKANRKIVVSPMPDRYAKPVAERLGIEVYSFAGDVSLKE